MPLEPRTTAADLPPSAYCNPYAAGPEVSQLICLGVRALLNRFRAKREVRALTRIGVLAPGWDDGGRHCAR